MYNDEKLDFLTRIAKALAAQFGENCEVVIHKISPDDIEHPIVSIENGHVTSRSLGDGPSQIVLESLQKDPGELKDHLNYSTRTHDGRILKSSTVYYKDEEGNLDLIFSINYDITNLIAVNSTIESLTKTSDDNKDRDPDYIPQNVNELLDDLIEESVKLVGKPVALMNKDDKIKCIQFLNKKGAFLITKSGEKVSNFFNISKYTLYSYIDAK